MLFDIIPGTGYIQQQDFSLLGSESESKRLRRFWWSCSVCWKLGLAADGFIRAARQVRDLGRERVTPLSDADSLLYIPLRFASLTIPVGINIRLHCTL